MKSPVKTVEVHCASRQCLSRSIYQIIVRNRVCSISIAITRNQLFSVGAIKDWQSAATTRILFEESK
jgi:hypothetical protein